MIVIHDLVPLKQRQQPIILACGFFDGLHIGHQRVLACAMDAARQINGETWVMTFDEHPLKVLKPEASPLLITATNHKLSLLRKSGIDGCILLPFTHEMAATSASAFAQWLFASAPTLRQVVTGENWRFGANAQGTPQMLEMLGAHKHINVVAAPPVAFRGETVSSTRIRQAITSGHLADAQAMLGRPPSVLGKVVHGRAIGRTMGYPSANLDPHNEALPPLGVYAVQASIGGIFYDGALNFGTRPTFDHDKAVPPLLELHLLDFDGSLYDQDIEAFFIARLRDEWYFATIDELKAQIADDIIQTRRILACNGMSAEMQSAYAFEPPT